MDVELQRIKDLSELVTAKDAEIERLTQSVHLLIRPHDERRP
jgi:hypothetical protein